jgi:hypothetical protein
MADRSNPLKLNPLQAKTLAILQVLAKDPAYAVRDEARGQWRITTLPHPHGDHFHVGAFVVSGRDASGLHNWSVHVALQRKGLVELYPPGDIALTENGLAYETGLAEAIFRGAAH